jgi:hypothetical protein
MPRTLHRYGLVKLEHRKTERDKKTLQCDETSMSNLVGARWAEPDHPNGGCADSRPEFSDSKTRRGKNLCSISTLTKHGVLLEILGKYSFPILGNRRGCRKRIKKVFGE